MNSDFKTVLIITLSRGDFYNIRSAIQYMTELHGVFTPRETALGGYGGYHYDFSDKLFIDLVDIASICMKPQIIIGNRYDYMIGADHMVCVSSPPRMAKKYIKFDDLHELFETLVKRPTYDKKEPLTPETFVKCLEDRYPGIRIVEIPDCYNGDYMISASVPMYNNEPKWTFVQTFGRADRLRCPEYVLLSQFISNLDDHYVQFITEQLENKLKENKEKY